MLAPEVIVDEEGVTLHRGSKAWWRFDVHPGERYAGIVRGSDNFEGLLLTERQFAAWHRGESPASLASETGNAFEFRKKATDFETWYLCVSTGAWISPIEVSIRVKKTAS